MYFSFNNLDINIYIHIINVGPNFGQVSSWAEEEMGHTTLNKEKAQPVSTSLNGATPKSRDRERG